MRFGEIIKRTGQELVISSRHDEWLKANSNPSYSEEALAFATEQLQQAPRDRRGTISASSLGSCRRRQMFTYLGMPELPPSPRTAQIFHTGTFMHIRWQMAGLTEGWLQWAEVPVGANDLQLSGTQDGVAYEGSVVELKSINSNGFSGVNTFGPKQDHLFQVGTYLYATAKEKGVILYENKDTQDYKEIVVHLDEVLAREIKEISERVWDYISNEELPEPLTECEAKTGWRYNSCPFRGQCLTTRNWAHAEEQASG